MAAIARCDACGRRMCDGCEVFIGVRSCCVGCARRVRARRLRIAGAVQTMLWLFAFAASIAAGVVLGMAQAEEPAAPPQLFALPR